MLDIVMLVIIPMLILIVGAMAILVILDFIGRYYKSLPFQIICAGIAISVASYYTIQSL